MFFELMGTVLAGLAAALLIFAIRRFAPDRLPVWLIPFGAGAAMILATISNEYGWYGRTTAQLPESFEIARIRESQAPYRPWTYVSPLKNGFIALDMGSLRTNSAAVDQRILDLYSFARWTLPQKATVLFDCAGARSAPLMTDAEFSPDGTVANVVWSPMPDDDPILRTACGSA